MKLIPLILLPLSLLAFSAQGENSGNPNRYSTMANSMMNMMDAFSSAYQKRGNAAGKQSQGNMPWAQGTPSWSPGSMPMQMGTLGTMSTMPMGWGSALWPQGSMPFSPQGSMPFSPQGSMPSWPQEYMPWIQSPPTGNPGHKQEYDEPLYQQGANVPVTELNGSWQGRNGEVLMIRSGRFRIYQGKNQFREGNLALEDRNMLSMQDPSSGTVRRYEYAVHQGKLALRDQTGNILLYRQVQ